MSERITIPELTDYSQVAEPERAVHDGYSFISEGGLLVYATGLDYVKNGVILNYPQWSVDAAFPGGQERAQLMSGIEQRASVIVSNPGASLDGRQIDLRSARSLMVGDISKVSIDQWGAVEETMGLLGSDMEDIRHINGVSLGSIMAGSAIATAPSAVKLDRVDLWEVPGQRSGQKLAAFILEYIRHGGDDFKKWSLNSPEWSRDDVDANVALGIARLVLKGRLPGLSLYPVAINKSPQLAEQIDAGVKRGTIDSKTSITIMHGSKSEISRANENIQLAKSMGELGLKVYHFEAEGATHAAQNNPGWWLDTVSRVHHRVGF